MTYYEDHLPSEPEAALPLGHWMYSALVLLLTVPLLLAGCGRGDDFGDTAHRLVNIAGNVHGGQQPVGGALIQVYAVGTTADGSAATPLLTYTVTTSDGSGNATNSNANASNGYNSYPAGAFSLPTPVVCPTFSSQIYITGVGGNPGLAAGIVNPNLVLMAVLGQCGDFTASSYVSINEQTTVGSVAPLSSFMNSYTSLGSGSADASQFLAALAAVNEYTNVSTGAVPGPTLPPGYYASSNEIRTLADIIASCVNSGGGVAGDGSSCGMLFSLVVPNGVTPPTDTVGAMLDIIKYPTNNVCAIFNMLTATGPYQPVLSTCPPNWELPIEPIVATPVISPVSGNYVGTQTVTLTDATGPAVIYYTTDGTIPTTSSWQYTSPFSVSSSATVKAIAAASGYATSAVAAATYVITPASTPVALVFVQQPSNTATGYSIAPPVSVAVEDASGNIVTNATNPVTISIATNPPPGSSSPGTLSGTLTATPSNGIATFLNPSIDVIANGYQLLATSPGLTAATSTAFNITPYPITISPASNLVGVGSTLPGSFTLSQPAPAAGVTVNLASSSGAVSIVPASVTLTSGQTVGNFTYTGISTGAATLSASATNYLTGTSVVTSTNSLISLGQLPVVAPGQTSQLALSLGVIAPPGGVTVTLTSSNTAAATITPSVFIPAGFKLGSQNPQITGVAMGTTTITASAPGYSPDIRTVNVSLSASFPASTTIPLTAANPVTLTISAPAPAGGLTFTLSSDSPSIASVPASITVPAGSTTVAVPVTGVMFGTTTIRADSPGVVEATTSVTVQANITMGSVVTGTNEYVPANVTLGATATPPTAVTITSLNPSIALVSASPTAAGTTSITLSNVTNSVPTFYVQGQSVVGTATLSISAPGYITATGTAVVDPVGVVFYGGANLNTTTISPASTITLATAILNPSTLAILGYNGTPNPGSPSYSIAVTSSSTSVGTITTSPVVFSSGGSGTATTSFNPLAAGSSTISLGSQPSGFYATTSTGPYLSGTAVVTANTGVPNIAVNVPTTGVGLQVPASVALQAAPDSPVNVTLTSTGNALLSPSSTQVGSSSITFQNVANTGALNFYVQGQAVGTATLTVSAVGYNTSTSTITVDQSGVVFNYGSSTSTFTTTSSSTPTTLSLVTAILDPRTLAVACPNSPPTCGYALNPGTSASINVNNGTPSIGSLTGQGTNAFGPVTIGTNGFGTTAFQPVNVGTTALTLGDQPAGFAATSSPNGYLGGIATVTGPVINVGSPTTGAGLYVNGNASFATYPTQPVTVTITSSNPSVATISGSPSTVGTQSVTFTNVSGTIPAFYVQGQSVGLATLSAFATGYTTGTAPITVDPSGIVIYEGNSSFTTTNFSSPTTVTLTTAILNPVTLTVTCSICYYPINPGTGPLTIPVTSSAPAVGTITNSPVTFPAGSSGAVTTAFAPLTAGTSTIALGTQPAGFSASGSTGYLSGTVTVTAPPVYVNINNVTTGVGLYSTGNASLSASTPSPVTVTITSSNPAVALLSASTSAVGTASITFNNITNSIPPFYVQGQTVGTSSLTATVSGYSTGTATITVDPSGIVFYQEGSSFSTTSFSTPTTLTLATAILDPVNLTVVCSICIYPLNPNTGPFSVPVTSGTTSVGTIVTSPVVFQPGSNGSVTTAFQPVGVGTSALTIGAQPVGFTAATSPGYVSGTATVTGPAINISAPTTGVDVYVGSNTSLAVAPPSPVTVTVISSNTAIATLSLDTVTVGTGTVTFSNVGNTAGLPFYVQGQSVGTATLTVSAPGYTTATATITVDPSGIVFYQGSSTSTFSTTSFSPPTTLTLSTALLDPKAFTVLCSICSYPLNPGTGPFSIPVTSTPTSVGTITNGTVTFPAGSNGQATTAFQPVAAGSAVLALGAQPAPFTASASTGYVNGTATVTGPCMTVNPATTGTGFYVVGNASLQVAPPSAVTVTLSVSNAAIALLSSVATTVGSSSISYNNITGSVPTFYIQGQSVGTTTITASAPGYCSGTATITVDPPSIVFFNGYYNGTNYTGATFSTTTFSSPSAVALATAILDPVSAAVVGTAYPLNPGSAPLAIGVTSSSTNIGTITSPVTFTAGGPAVTTASFQPASVGNTTLALGTEPAGLSTTSSTTSSYLNGTATVTGPTFSMSSPTTGAGVYVSANASLSIAPPSPVTVTITSSNPAVALLSASAGTVGSPSLTFNNITGSVPTFYVQGLTAGTSTMTAVATGYTTANTTIQVDPLGIVFQNGLNITTTTFSSPTTFSVSDALLDPVTLEVVATGLPFNPNYGPYSIALSSTNTNVGTVTPTVTFAQGGTGVQIASFQPVNAGTTTISLGTQPAGFTSTLSSGTYLNGPATVNGPTISVPNPTTGYGQYISTSASLQLAPPTSTTVTITSSSPSVALLSTSATTIGSSSITFNNVTGTTIPAFYVQGQTIGTSVLMIAATGYVTGTGTITVDPSGVVFYQGSNSSTLTTTTYSPPTAMTLATAILDPGSLAVVNYNGIPNPGTSLSIPVTSSSTTVGTVTSPVTFAAGANTATTTFTPSTAGSTTVALGTQPSGFTTTTSTPGYLSGTVTVTAPNVTLSSVTTGYGLTNSGTVALGTAPPSAVIVTLTVANPSVATLSTTANGGGSSSITFSNVGTTSPMMFYVLGQSVGSTALNVTATGYNGTSTISVDPSGFGFTSAPTFTTTSLSGNTTLTVTTLVLNPGTLTVLSTGLPLSAGFGSASLAVTSSNSATGTIVTSPVVISSGVSSVQTGFQPVGAGTSTIALGAQPAGYSTPSQSSYLQGTATVTSSAINVPSAQTTGVNLTVNNLSVSLGGVPSSPVTITVTSSSPAVVTLDAEQTATVVGTASITFTNVSGTAGQYFNLQGQSAGTSVITVSAPGYTTTTFNVTVDPSGLGFASAPTFNTTPQSGNTVLTIYTLVLTPGSLTEVGYNLPVNPGLGTVSIPVTSSNTAVGTILTSPVVFSAGASSVQTSFQPAGGGTSTIAVGAQPSGFSTPSSSGNVQGTATVTAPNINVPGSQIIGVSLSGANLNVSLAASPTVPETFTLTSSDPTIVTIGAGGGNPTVVGTQTITLPNITGTGGQYFNIQGQGLGTATITVTAPGYNSNSFTVTVYPSGFVFSGGNQDINTTTFSSNTTLTIYTAVLNPGSLTLYNYNLPINPGIGPFSVPVTSSNTSVGTVTTSPLMFSTGTTYLQTSFKPAAAGTTTIALAQPAGFSTDSQTSTYISGTATVVAPGINVPGSVITGVSMANTGNSVSLSQNPPGPVTITMTIADPTIATLGMGYNATTVGVSSLTFTNVANNGGQGFNIQGQAQGTTTVTVSAPGFNTNSFTVNVYPSGFVFSGGNQNINTTTFSSNTTLTIYTAVLNPGSLTLYNYNLPINPGIGPFSVPVTSSNTSVGTITTSPLVFTSGTTYLQTAFTPGTAGTTTVALAQPAGFSTDSQTSTYISGTATVVAPNINVPGTVITGVSMANTGQSISLSQTPPSPVTITMTIADPTIATLGMGYNSTTVGVSSLTFTNVANNGGQGFNIQGQAQGTTTVTVSAPGFNINTFTVNVYPSGFIFSGNNESFTTTTFSANTTLTIYTAVLNPGTLTLYNYNLPINPGVGPFAVPVTSSNTSVGTITSSPLMFTSGTTYLQTAFKPLAAGTTTIAVAQPAGFSIDSQTSAYISGTTTVTAPYINVPGNQTTGVNLTNTSPYFYLAQSPPSPVTVTVTSSDPTIATLGVGSNATAVGTTSIAFTNVSNTAGQYFNIQGQGVGTATITVSAPGFNPSTFTVTVDPSGFGFSSEPNFNTTTSSSPTTLTLYTMILSPGTLNEVSQNYPLNPGIGPFSVPVTSSTTSVGTITTSPVVFSAGVGSATTSFQPVGSGSTTLSIGAQPTGFSTPSQSGYVLGFATVQ